MRILFPLVLVAITAIALPAAGQEAVPTVNRVTDSRLGPQGTFDLVSRVLSVEINDTTAKVNLKMAVKNISNRDQELDLMLPVPGNVSLSAFRLAVDGQDVGGTFHTASEARRIYSATVAKRKDPTLLEYLGSGLFRVS